MPIIQQLSPQVADMIAAGEVVERPASAAKELVENSIDAGAKNITVELQNGMTYLRVTDDGCGMSAEDAQVAFLRHATSKLREAADLEAIRTLGFRGEALAAISAVSRIDLLTKTAEAAFGVSLHLEAGVITERSEAGCPNGTTIIVRDLFYNTPARMKFMKRDAVEAAALLSAVQRLALAHPEVSIRVLRDGEEQLHTAGDGSLYSAVYAVLGKQLAKEMVQVDSRWERYGVSGYVSKPTATRGNRASQIFFVNGRHVRSKTMTAALEEAYRNQLMVGRFPSCVLHLRMPEHLVDVNVHPAKVEVKFLNERDVFDCIRCGVEGALAQTSGRAEMRLPAKPAAAPVKKEVVFRQMTAEDYRAFLDVLQDRPAVRPAPRADAPAAREATDHRPSAPEPVQTQELPATPQAAPAPETPQVPAPEAQQAPPPYRIIGEAFDTYILVEQGRELLLIDKHAAHERILFEALRKRDEPITSQLLLQPILCRPEREAAAVLLENAPLLNECGFELSDYGDGTLAVRRIPAEIDAADTEAALTQLASDLLHGKRTEPTTLRETMLHTVACKAAIKGGRHSDAAEREALVRQVLSREDLKYCPHGRPICSVLTAAQLERQFKRA